MSRSNSDPEILDKLTPLDLNRIKALQICDSIPEEGNTSQGTSPGNQPGQRIRARSNTIDSSSPTKPVKRMERLMMIAASKKAAATAPHLRKDVTPELMLEQLLRAGGISGMIPGVKAGNWLLMATASKNAAAMATRTKKNASPELLDHLPGTGDRSGPPGSAGIPGLHGSGGIPGSSNGEQFLVLPKTRQFQSSLRILDMIPYQVTY